MSKRRLLAVAALMLVLAACSGDGTSPTETQSTSNVTATSGTETTTSTPTTTGGATSSTSAATTTQPPTTTLPTTTTTTTSPTTTVGNSEPAVINVAVSDGEVSGPGRVQVPRGASIRLTVTSDEADEVHFHGYDIYADVAPGEPAIMLVQATIPGVFEVELEGAGLELVLIEVA